jgi:uncharacterized protein
MQPFLRLWQFKSMELFGPDFQRAKTQWLYPIEKQQWLLRASLLFVALLVIDGAFQLLGGIGAYTLVYPESLMGFFDAMRSASPDFMKASIIGMMPAAILTIICILYLSKFGIPHQKGELPLSVPKLGVLGWLLVVLCFMVLMFMIFNGTFYMLGIDPSTYSPSGGLNDTTSSSGLVEKTVAELTSDPLLFGLALPGIILAAPLTEELIFRGALFSAIASSPLGRVGAVLITSALWALAHKTAAPWLFVAIIFVMGLLLGTLLLRFGSIWVTIVCHTVWNTLTSLAIFGYGLSH